MELPEVRQLGKAKYHSPPRLCWLRTPGAVPSVPLGGSGKGEAHGNGSDDRRGARLYGRWVLRLIVDALGDDPPRRTPPPPGRRQSAPKPRVTGSPYNLPDLS